MPITVPTADDLAAAVAAQDARTTAIEARVAALEAASRPKPPLMRFGYSQANGDKLEAATKATTTARRIYYTSVPKAAPSTPPGCLPVVSIKPGDWNAAANGAIDAAVAAYVRSISRDLVLIFNHEPENDYKSAPAQTAAAFQAMTTHLFSLVHGLGNPHVTLAVNLMTWGIGRGGEAYLPTTTVPHILSWDGYSHIAGQTPAQLFGPALAINKTRNQPFAICETASDVNPAWVKDVADWSAANGAVFCCYWPSATGAYDYYPSAAQLPLFTATALKYGGTAIA